MAQIQNHSEFRLPATDEHITIVGRNGTGKTQFGAWVLSKHNLKTKPWYLLDYKGEELFAGIDRTRQIGFNETPSQPGLYVLHSRPDLEIETENWLWRVWDSDGGLFIDEGYMLPNASRKGPFDAILTQGRTRGNPVITLSQRPVKVSLTAFSEASHIVAFDLNYLHDRKRIEEYSFPGILDDEVPRFHSRWYGVKPNRCWIVKPVPDADTIANDINVQLEPKKRWI